MLIRIAFLFFFLIATTVLGAEIKPLQQLGPAELQARLSNDMRTVQIDRAGLRSLIGQMEAREDLFPAKAVAEARLLRREQKELIWHTWQRFLDYQLSLQSVERYESNFQRLKGNAREDAFLIGYSSMLARYRSAIEFIHGSENTPEIDKILNDSVPELGLPAGSFAKLKFAYLNAAIATEFVAREAILKTFPGQRQSALRQAIKEDSDFIWKTGRGKGPVLTVKNALKIVQDTGSQAWLPVQAGVAEWMGDVKVYRPHKSLITERQIHEIHERLAPGDVLLERREWYLSNVGLPGFWSHAALYVGTAEERRRFFDDSETRAWVKAQGEATGELESVLKAQNPAAYASAFGIGNDSNPPVRIIEAIGEGVSLTTLEHSAGCDSLAVLRPRLSKAERARALVRALHYTGRPYDYNFDFATDAELVCTELIYKSFEPAQGYTGLRLPLTEVLGRKVTPANEIAKQFDQQYQTAQQQFDLILFLDGQERQDKAVESSASEFCQSWRRPKWHVLVQPEK